MEKEDKLNIKAIEENKDNKMMRMTIIIFY